MIDPSIMRDRSVARRPARAWPGQAVLSRNTRNPARTVSARRAQTRASGAQLLSAVVRAFAKALRDRHRRFERLRASTYFDIAPARPSRSVVSSHYPGRVKVHVTAHDAIKGPEILVVLKLGT